MNVKELLDTLQDAMEELKGKDIRKTYVTKLVDEAVSTLPVMTRPFSVKDNRLWYETAVFGEIPIAEFKAQYNKDKRTCDGLGYRIERVDVTFTQELPLDLDITKLNRQLQYDAARKRKEEAERNIRLLEQQIETENTVIKEMASIMKDML